MTAYCTPDDLLVGDVPLPAYISIQQVVDDAADEIDSKIGFRYQTPIDISTGNTSLLRPVKLLLKRLNAALASGRLLLQVDVSGEDNKLHAYGLSLITEATKTLDMIATGHLDLSGAVLITDDSPVGGPQISNLDVTSTVEYFYDTIANPNAFPFGVPTYENWCVGQDGSY